MIHDGAVRYYEGLKTLMVDIDSIQQHPDNYNNGDVEAIKESILENGMYRPVYVQESTNYELAGNHTWQACKELGARQIPVVYLDADSVTSDRIMITDNRSAALAKPDNGLLLSLLNRIEQQSENGLSGTGYQAQDMEVLRHLQEIENTHDEFGQWPTIIVQVPPNVRTAYMNMTREADSDRDRFELMLRLAGWDGS